VSSSLRVRELSAPGRGAVSVLAVEGPGAAALLERLCTTRLPPPGGLALVRIREDGVELDEALLASHGPERYELQVHGSPPLVRRLLALSEAPADRVRPLQVEARALRLLESAQGAAAARMLLDQAEGALRRELSDLAYASLARRQQSLDALSARARVARWLVEPARVVIAGPANAGKSTLFNVLLGEGRAIVHAAPGTTRDALREPAFLGAYPIWLHDTAGERSLGAGERGAGVEAEGQRRARLLAQSADLVLWLDPSGAHPGAQGRCLRSRASRAALAAPDTIAALEEPEHARARIAAIFREAFALPENPWSSGAGVPFDSALAAQLARLDCTLDPEAWGRAIARLLGAPGPVPNCLFGPDALS